jgi:tRNA(Ile)-lysidine synthase
VSDAAPIGSAEAERLLEPLARAPGLLLAVSGGPDSMALMALAAHWGRAKGRPPIYVATVDHALRAGSRAEAEMVAQAAGQLGLPHRILTRSGAPFQTRIQERAREARYKLLAAEAQCVGATNIVTAHHTDDQAETVLMRLMHGSGPAGLAGMAPVTSLPSGLMLTRPFLTIPKARLIATCQAMQIAFCDDPSNLNETFERVRVRKLAPDLAKEGLDAAALGRLAVRAGRAEAALAAVAEEALARLRRRAIKNGVALMAADLADQPEEIALRILAALVREVGGAAVLRLERLERVGLILLASCKAGLRHKTTLSGTVLTFDGRGTVTIVQEKERRRGRSKSGRSV